MKKSLLLLFIFLLSFGIVSAVECTDGMDNDGDGLYDVYGACRIGTSVSSCSDMGYYSAVACSSGCGGTYLPYDNGCHDENDDTEDVIELEIEGTTTEAEAISVNVKGGDTYVLGGDVSGLASTFTSGQAGAGTLGTTREEEMGGDKPECSDSIDNDADSLVDYPADPSCTSKEDNQEARFGIKSTGFRGAPEEEGMSATAFWAWVLAGVALFIVLVYWLTKKK